MITAIHAKFPPDLDREMMKDNIHKIRQQFIKYFADI